MNECEFCCEPDSNFNQKYQMNICGTCIEVLNHAMKQVNRSVDFERVEVTSFVPEFMGTDLRKYGPYNEGDIARVPKDNADILLNRGNAVKGNETGEGDTE